jgi:uncharacterized membrane protein
MNKTVLGLFTRREDAERAIEILKDDDYDAKDISIVLKDTNEAKEISENTGAGVAEGAVSGATTGAIIGGLAGLLASFVIPGLGAFFIGGPIAAALGLGGAAATTVSGAATGALAGGLLGGLMNFGMSEDQAKVYEERIQSGAILVAVPARRGEERIIEQILLDCNADDVNSFSQETSDRFETRTSEPVDVDVTEDEDVTIEEHQPRATFAGMKGGKSRSRRG